MRFDAIAVARLTFDSFARRPEFDDPLYRGAVMVSVLRILMWCAAEVSHPQRPAFRLALRAMFRLIDPRWMGLPWLHLPHSAPEELGDVEPARAFLLGLEPHA